MTMGIYLIENKTTKQKYIGQSIDIERRWREHSVWTRNTSYIDKSIAKYGIDNFSIDIIEVIKDANDLDKREQYWINYYNTYKDKNHYNLTPGGDFNPMKVQDNIEKMKQSLTGRKLKQETKEKMSKSRKGCKNPMYGKKGVKSPNYGRKFSKESIEKMSRSASLSRNTTGYYRVYKEKMNNKQGYRWCYWYLCDGKKKVISSVDFSRLEEKVRNKKLKWCKIEDI